MAFGIGGRRAEILDTEDRGTEKVMTIAATAFTKSGAVQAARTKAAPVIPLIEQDVEVVDVDRELSFRRTRYLVRVAHNEDTGY